VRQVSGDRPAINMWLAARTASSQIRYLTSGRFLNDLLFKVAVIFRSLQGR
jgi:hypothetical protein